MQRYVRLFGTPITLLLLLGLLLYGAWWGRKNLLAPVPTPAPVPCASQKVGPQLTTSKVTVRVYNGGTQVGLAGQVGSQLTNAGFRVAGTGNTDQKVTTTVIVGSAAADPEVKLVLGFFKNAKVRADKRVDHTVDVLVGSTFGGMNPKAPRSIAVSSGTVCLPSPSATNS